MPKAPAEPDWLDVDQAMHWMGLETRNEKAAFRKGIEEGYIPACKLTNRIIRIHRKTVLEAFTKRP